MREPYRVTILHATTYEQQAEYVMRLGWFYALVSALALVLVLSTASLIVFTPLREFIPGYTDTGLIQKQEFLLLKVEEMEDKIAQRDSIINSMIRVTNVDPAATSAPEPATEKRDTDRPAAETDPSETSAPPESEPQPAIASRRYVKTKDAPPFRFYEPVVNGFLTNTFKPKEQHFAIDLAAGAQQPIRSIADGYVIFADYTVETGHVIGVHHAHDFVSFYKHNRSLHKNVGDFVKAGEDIAVIGNSGENSTGPHLHFELWHKGKPIDPLLYFRYKQF